MISNRARRLLAGGGIIAIAMAIMNVATYGFTMIAANLLGPQSYGAFAALMNLLLVVSVASLGLQSAAARRIASDPDHVAQIEWSILDLTKRVSLPLGLLLMACSPLIMWVLKLENIWQALIVGIAAVPLTYQGAQMGILQGERRWGALSLMYLAASLPRLIVGTALIVVEPSATWALIGVTVGYFAPVVVGWWALRGHRKGAVIAEHSRRNMARETVRNSQALLAFFVLCNVDIVVARNVVDAHDSGLYASGLILTKVMLFLPQFVVVVAFPAMSTAAERIKALTRGLGLIAVIGVLGTLASWLLADVALIFIGGPEFAEVKGSLWLFALLGTVLSMLQLLVYSALAQQMGRASVLMWLGLVLLVTIGMMTSSFTALVAVVTGVDCVLLIALLALAVRSGSREATPDAEDAQVKTGA